MKKKGFTLIELLAVIVILAIIALIATPLVADIIKKARISANARSVEGHIGNVEYVISDKLLSSGSLFKYDITDSSLSSDIVVDNDKIECLSYTIKSGIVISANYCKDSSWDNAYSYSTSKGAYLLDFNGTYVAPQTGETHKGIVYLDPSDISKKCDENSEITTTNTGCKKFYIYDVDGSYYKMIMDRNVDGNVAWIKKDDYIAAGGIESEYGTNGNNRFGPITVNKSLAERTTGWIGNPRMITGDEIAHIVGADLSTTIKWNSSKEHRNADSNTNPSAYISAFYLDGSGTTYSMENGWYTQTANSKGASKYSWLYDYTTFCETNGCNISLSSTSGYWTSTGLTKSNVGYSWIVKYQGVLTPSQVKTSASYGIRPVIELPIPLVTPFNGKYVASQTGETHKGIVYLDPSNISNICNKNSTITTGNTGCKKFYIFEDEGSTYKMIMDRNLGAGIKWISINDFISAGGTEIEYGTNGNNSLGPITAVNYLNNQTVNWLGNPRMITADEIAHIVGADREDTLKWDSSKIYGISIDTQSNWFFFDGFMNSNPMVYPEGSNGWQKQVANATVKSNYAWLYDYLKNCGENGCNKNSTAGLSGYWTSTKIKGISEKAWYITNSGAIGRYQEVNFTGYGVRPVVEIPKVFVDN